MCLSQMYLYSTYIAIGPFCVAILMLIGVVYSDSDHRIM